MIRRFGLIGTLALAALASAAPSALATYPGRNGVVAYQDNENDPNNGNVEFSGISSIPTASAANCSDTSPNGDQGVSCMIARFGYSPDGSRIVAERSGRLEVLDANGKNVTIFPALTSQDTDPAFLPGGKTIVFTGRANGKSNLYTVQADGTGLKPLTTQGGSWAAPCASGSIAFINHGALYVMKANGSGLRRLARNAETPDCAPNSKSIIYSGSGSDFVVNTKGGKAQRMKGGDGGWPTFSPDGKLVASVQNLPSSEAGGYEVPTVVVERKNGKRVRRVDYGNNLHTKDFGPVDWRPKH